MAGVFHKAMVWLGLAPDEEYSDYGFDAGARRPPAPGVGGIDPGAASRVPGHHAGPPAGGAAVPGYESPEPVQRPVPRTSGTIRPMPARPMERGQTPTVRPMRPTSAKPAALAPGSFDDAKELADRFKADQPVVMDLSGADRDLARRLIDFSSGICYSLGGRMERVAPGTYLLTPPGVEVSDEERRRLAGDG